MTISRADPSAPLRAALRHLGACSPRGLPHEIVQAHTEVARNYADEGALGTAEAYFEQALRWCEVLPGIDGRVDLLCEAAETAASAAERHQPADPAEGGRARGRARSHALEATRLAEHVADPAWEIRVLLRVSDVYDRCGSRDEAVELQTRAVRLMARQGLAAP